MHIGILPYELRSEPNLANISIDSLYWPIGKPDYGLSVKDLLPHDHVLVYPSSRRILRSIVNVTCNVDLLLAEPKSVHAKYYRILWLLRRKFSLILSRYPEYANKYNNVISVQVAETWVQAESISNLLWESRDRLCSIIASNKKDLIGHQLRHQVVNVIKEKKLPIDVLGRAYQPFEHKWEGLIPYKYSVVIENNSELHYFSEKLLDAFMCNTIPIYWGAPNISDYFDIDGMIVCHNLEQLVEAIDNLPVEIKSDTELAMARNRETAESYGDLNHRLALTIKNHLDVVS